MGLGSFFNHLPGIRQRIRTIGQARADAARMNNAPHLRFEYFAIIYVNEPVTGFLVS
jgi:hypothetical protein